MRQTLATALPVAALGLLLAVVPFHLLPVCEVRHGAAPMRCYWSGMALAGFGVAFLLAGGLLFFLRSCRARRNISLAVIVTAVAAATLPTFFIGMCAAPTMRCRVGTYPAVMAVLTLIALAGIFNILYLKYGNAREHGGHEATHNLAYSTEQS